MFTLLRVERCMRKTTLLRFLIICSLLRFSCRLLPDLRERQKHVKHKFPWPVSGGLDCLIQLLASPHCEMSKDVHHSNLAPKRKYFAKIPPGNCELPDPFEGIKSLQRPSIIPSCTTFSFFKFSCEPVNQHAGCKSSYKTLLQEGIGHVNWRT